MIDFIYPCGLVAHTLDRVSSYAVRAYLCVLFCFVLLLSSRERTPSSPLLGEDYVLIGPGEKRVMTLL